jgi:hypothetical protein
LNSSERKYSITSRLLLNGQGGNGWQTLKEINDGITGNQLRVHPMHIKDAHGNLAGCNKHLPSNSFNFYMLTAMRFHHRHTIDNPECNETLQECTTLAELLTASQDLCEAHTRALRGQISLSKIFAGQST